jgi:WD40 repeat protein
MWQQKVKRGGVYALVYSPDSNTIYTGDGTGSVTAWNRQSGTSRELFKVKGKYTNGVRQLAVTSDGRFALAAADSAPFRVWDLNAGTLWAEGPTAEYIAGVFAISPDNRTVAYSVSQDTRFWDLRNRAPSTHWPTIKRPVLSSLVSELAWSSSGVLAMVDAGGGLYLLAPGADQFDCLNADESTQRIIHYETALPVFSADGSAIAVCAGWNVFIWDVASGGLRRTIQACKALVHRLAFHPEGRLLAAAGNTKRIYLLDTAAGREVNRYDWGIGNEIQSLAFSPEGMSAAAGGSSGKFVVWDIDEA